MVPAGYFQRVEHVPASFSIKEMGHLILHGHTYIQNMPLYYVILKEWVKVFGDSIYAIRFFSALISLFAFPLIYWLCMELFQSRKVAVTAMILLAVSPFHVLYAQEARPYSLTAILILFSSAALLKAQRQQTAGGWLLYLMTMVIGLYSHVLFMFIAASHCVYMLLVNRFKLNVSLRSYLGVTLISLISFAPWAYMVISNTTVVRFSDFTGDHIPRLLLIQSWGDTLRRTFIDSNLSFENSLFFVLLLMCLFGYALFYFIRNNKNHGSRLFIFNLLAVTAGTLMCYDLILGEKHSYYPRFLMPGILGVEIIVAYFLAGKFDSGSPLERNVWRGIFVFIVAGGLVSCAISSQAGSWWNKALDVNTPSIVKVINSSRSPVVILPRNMLIGRVFSLALMLDSTVNMVSNRSGTCNDIDHFNEIYLIEPSEVLLDSIKNRGYKIIGNYQSLVKLVKVSPGGNGTRESLP